MKTIRITVCGVPTVLRGVDLIGSWDCFWKLGDFDDDSVPSQPPRPRKTMTLDEVSIYIRE